MIKGKIWKYGDNVNTDVIFPGKYTYTVTDKKEMVLHAMEDLDPSFSKNVQKNDIIVAGKNFGCGSSREQAAFCLKYAGVGAIIAESFSRIYFRNAINAGLPVIVQKEISQLAKNSEILELNFEEGNIFFKNKNFNFPPIPGYVMGILKEGGLESFIKRRFQNENA